MAEKQFELISGQLALDFINTIGGLRGGASAEFLNHYENLLSWSRQTDTVTEEQARQLGQAAENDPGQANVVLERALLLREAIYRLFSATIYGKRPAAVDLAILNDALVPAMTGRHLILTPDGFSWGWAKESESLDWVLWPVARAAADLLTSDDMNQVRQCANDSCSWVFIDTTKNHSRRWCDMKVCGNRAKVNRYRQRQRNAPA